MQPISPFPFIALCLSLGPAGPGKQDGTTPEANLHEIPGEEEYPDKGGSEWPMTSSGIRERIAGILRNPPFSWEDLVWTASSHMVMPALYTALRRYQLLNLLPGDLTAHLEHIWSLNHYRNLRIMDQAREIAGVLSGEGIRPVFLKGAAGLVSGLYPETADRIMIDIDILVPSGEIDQAARAIQEMGYRYADEAAVPDLHHHHHYPMMIRDGEVAGIELHHHIMQRRYARMLPEGEIFAGCRPVLDGLAAIPAVRHQILHHFIHDQLVHWQFPNRTQQLRGLYDFFLLSQQEPLSGVAPVPGRLRRRFTAYAALAARSFGHPASLRLPHGWYARGYLYTWDLLQREEPFYRYLHRALIQINRYGYLTRFVLSAVHRPDRRRFLVRRLMRVIGMRGKGKQ